MEADNTKTANQTSSGKQLYPKLVIKNNEHPNRLLAFPLLGYIFRIIIILPQLIILFFMGLWLFILWLITPFVILFTGKYWDYAYNFNLTYFQMYTKLGVYVFGLTDTYPGFSMDESGIFELHFEKPASPSRLLSFPLLGFLIRIILLIPYFIYAEVLGRGAFVGLICSWFGVLFTGKYPESLYEFIKDSIRVSISGSMYLFYLSDTYPSFSISMNHKAVKIILLILGTILMLFSFFPKSHANHSYSTQYNYPSPSSPTNP